VVRRILGSFIVVTICALVLAEAGHAQYLNAEGQVQEYAQAPELIPGGTVITHQNWQQYKNFMPDGLQALWQGTYHWKFPPGFQMAINPPTRIRLPKVYAENTKKYSGQVQDVQLPNGGHDLKGYTAGLPFPDPGPPDKGWKVLANVWYRYVPWLVCSVGGPIYLEDRYGSVFSQTVIQAYRRMSYISDIGRPIFDPQAKGVDYVEDLQVLTPEQSRYFSNLTIFYTDIHRPEQVYLFVPALRRALRVSSAARCTPVLGADLVQDDSRDGFNGGLDRFQSQFLRNQNILTMVNPPGTPWYLSWADVEGYKNPNGLLFPTPKAGRWEVRPTYVIDVRRIPSQQAGYCYGKVIIYVDGFNWTVDWKDIYDSGMKFWKSQTEFHWINNIPGEGYIVEGEGAIDQIMLDQQMGHLSLIIGNTMVGGEHQMPKTNSECENFAGYNFTDADRWSSVSGLMKILR
jgi:hypothetical protein